MHPSPNLLRSTVMGCEAKYELTKKRCQGGIFWSEIEVFGEEKLGHICYIADFRQNRVLKRSSEISGGKMEFFPKKVIRKFPSHPKVGAKSLPMGLLILVSWFTEVIQ